MTRLRLLGTTTPALVCLACGTGGGLTNANTADPAAAILTVAMDSTQYHVVAGALGIPRVIVLVSVRNSGPVPVFLMRRCSTGSVPSGRLSRSGADTTSVDLQLGPVCAAGGTSDSNLPDPIALAPSASFSWADTAYGTSQSPQARVTGAMRLEVKALTSNHKGSQVQSGDYLTLDRRVSPTFTVAPP